MGHRGYTRSLPGWRTFTDPPARSASWTSSPSAATSSKPAASPTLAHTRNQRGRRAGLQVQLHGKQSAERLTVEEMEKAPAEMKAKLYASLGVRLECDYVLKRVRGTAETACVPVRVRRGT